MPDLQLDTPIRFVRGVGPGRGGLLSRAGIETVADLLQLSPVRYEIVPSYKPISEWQDGETACIAGEILRVSSGGSFRTPTVTVKIQDGHETCRMVWFNMPYVRPQMVAGTYICATGKIQYGDGEAEMINPGFQVASELDEVQLPDSDGLQPIYSAIGSWTSKAIGKVIAKCLAEIPESGDPLPELLRRKRQLVTRASALRQVHRPESLESAAEGRCRLAYDELLMWQLEFARSRRQRQGDSGASILHVTPEIDRRIRRRFPFTLTSAQDSAIASICADLASARPMFRLLQGDVGCGKTAVAVYAALVAVANRHQAVLLAPTEILAQQHFEKMKQYLEGSAVRIALSSGALDAGRRRSLLSALRDGEVDFVVGTHALLEPDVEFKRLGLVVIDEQHRFGVRQRAALKSKGPSPHYLVLSATPIPRTQALALMGDLDISVIDILPAGRRRVATKVVRPRDVEQAWSVVRRQLDAGRQAYMVFPLVEESEKLPLKAVTTEFERLCAGRLSGYRCAMLHGRMKSDEKEEIVGKFRTKEVQVLVCTTVIEVGVDVPEATVMAVFHAERYGLAQLHQLRGRVGRAGDEAYFFLFAEQMGDLAFERLRTLETTADGFEIAAVDLKLRGPGRVLGTEQHGLAAYRFANLGSDLDLLQAAQEDAQAIIRGDIRLTDRQYNQLCQSGPQQHKMDARLVHVG